MCAASASGYGICHSSAATQENRGESVRSRVLGSAGVAEAELARVKKILKCRGLQLRNRVQCVRSGQISACQVKHASPPVMHVPG